MKYSFFYLISNSISIKSFFFNLYIIILYIIVFIIERNIHHERIHFRLKFIGKFF